MKKNKKKTAQEPKAQEQFLVLSIHGATIPSEVAQRVLTSLPDNILLFDHRKQLFRSY